MADTDYGSPYQRLLASPDAPYPLDTTVQQGQVLIGRAPDPDVTVLGSRVVHVRALKYHVLDLDVANEARTRVEHVRVGRLVAELEGDAGETEIERFLLPSEEEEPPIDLSTCRACLMRIVEGEAVLVDGAAYHNHCIMQD